DVALPALEAVENSADPEVRLRVRSILADLRLGIAPDWPIEMVELVRKYPELGEDARHHAITRLQQTLKERAVPFLLSRIETGTERETGFALDALRGLDS